MPERIDFVKNVVKDPANPPDVVVLSGYAGDAAEEHNVRLYSTPDLSEYSDIPRDAVLYVAEVPDDPLGSVIAWVRRDAEISNRGRGRAEVKARFFSGDIAAEYMTGVGTAAHLTPVTHTAITQHNFCITVYSPWCRTRDWRCLITKQHAGCGFSAQWVCPTRGPCPSAVDACPSAPGLCGHDFTDVFQTPVLGQAAAVPAAGQYRAYAAPPQAGIQAALATPGFIRHTWLVTQCGINCPKSHYICPTPTLLNCPSQAFACQSVFRCPTQLACPSIVDACPSAPGGCWTMTPDWGITPQVTPGGFQATPGPGF